MIEYLASESNIVCGKCNTVKDPSGFSYKLKMCDVRTDYVRAYNASKHDHMKQYRRAY